MAKGKGYKLTSAATDGMPKTCAFFFSDKGCRNGANCKFSHDKPSSASPGRDDGAASVSSSSVVSSESESDGEVIEKQAGAYASLGSAQQQQQQQQQPECVNPFLTAVNSVPTPAVVTNAPKTEVAAVHQQQPPVVVEKKKKKRKKSKDNGDGNIFDLGQVNNASSPTKNNVNGTAAILESVAAVVAPPAKKAKKQQQQAAAVVVVAPPVKKEKQQQQQQQQQHPTQATNTSAPPSFRNLQLPIASFSLPTATTTPVPSVSPSAKKARPPSPQHEPAPNPPPLPLPTATSAHLKWKSAVQATQSHVNFRNAFNYERAQQLEQQQPSSSSSGSSWITCRPYDKSWASSNPASIAIDCEMCETKDPISGNVDTKALCRISIVNGENPSEVLLDTLVKPQWPVTKHRTFVNGITEDDLRDVQFTLQHAQTFMLALCSNQTVIIGHAVHNDLLALKMIHYCVCDTALLYKHVDVDDGTPSLKNLAFGVLKREMPNVHDSVNDARVALECAQHYVTKNGNVDGIEKVYSRSNSSRNKLDSADTAMLLVHRLPTSTQPQHISEMFVAYTYIKPKSVADINFSGNFGKCHVEFTTMEHAELAYMSLVGDEREDKTGKKQKRVGLKGGGYVCVRKMKKEK